MKISQPFKAAAALFALCVVSGCVATTTDVDRLQDSLNTVQKGQADLIHKMDELDSSIGKLGEKLNESQKKMTALTQKLDDTQARLGGRMEGISQLLAAATTQAAVPVPGEVYRTAYADYLAGKWDLAIGGFRLFTDRYPSSDLADDAQFYLADSYLSKKDFNQARAEIDKYLSSYTELRASGLLKRASAFDGLNKTADQRATLQALIKEFPESNEAQAAKQILSALEEAEKPKEKPKSAPVKTQSAPQKKGAK